MTKLLQIGAIALATLAGCASTTDTLNATQAVAIDPAIQMSRFAMGGPERYEYTVGVEGCGKRMTSVVICTEGPADCFSTGNQFSQ